MLKVLAVTCVLDELLLVHLVPETAMGCIWSVWPFSVQSPANSYPCAFWGWGGHHAPLDSVLATLCQRAAISWMLPVSCPSAEALNHSHLSMSAVPSDHAWQCHLSLSVLPRLWYQNYHLPIILKPQTPSSASASGECAPPPCFISAASAPVLTQVPVRCPHTHPLGQRLAERQLIPDFLVSLWVLEPRGLTCPWSSAKCLLSPG